MGRTNPDVAQSKPRPRRVWLIGLAVLLAALGTRFGFLWNSPDRNWPHAVCFEGDATTWVGFAESLQRGTVFEFGMPIHPPGMAYLLSWVWNANSSTGFFAQKSLFCVLGAASCLLTWLLARRLFGERVAAIAGLLTAASFALTVQNASLNNETPYTFLLLLIALLTLHVAERRSWLGVALLAVMNGLAVLVRVEHTLVFVVLAAYLAWRWRRSVTRAPAPSAAPQRSASASNRDRKGAIPSPAKKRSVTGAAQAEGTKAPGTAISLALLALVYFLVPLPWNIHCYRSIQRFNTVEPRPVDYAAARPPWTPDAIAYLRALPAFAREGNFRFITDVAASVGLREMPRNFVDDWFHHEAGFVPRPLSPFVFVSNQGPLCFALANNASADGGFSTTLLNPEGPGQLAFGNPRHLRLYECGYSIGVEYLVGHPGDALRLLGRKLAIFGAGLTQGFTPADAPLGVAGLRRSADQMGPAPGAGLPWRVAVFGLAGLGAAASIWRRSGAICFVVIATKVLVTLAFFGYVREAVSILPFFLTFVAFGLDAVVLGPAMRRWPRAARLQTPIFIVAVCVVLASAAWCATWQPRYDVSGSLDVTPRWGPGAFESHQPLMIQQMR